VSKLDKAIQEAIENTTGPNSAGTIYFHWDRAEKTWCLSGSTKSGLYWESDDVEADNKKDARNQAIDHLTAVPEKET
jgi:hypothetical protein